MWAWWRGTQLVRARVQSWRCTVPAFVRMMRNSSVNVIPGTAFFLTGDADIVPSALLHNIKHNRVLHEQTVLPDGRDVAGALCHGRGTRQRRGAGRLFPAADPALRLHGDAECQPGHGHARRAGLKFDVMASTFFLGRRARWRRAGAGAGAGPHLCGAEPDGGDPTDFYHLPRDRVVELGERVAI
jgi:KUP system potassium uptake protein